MNRLRRIRVRSVLVLLLCAGLGGILEGCGGDRADGDSGWTVREGGLTLERELFLGDDEPYFFGEIGGFAVRDDGRIYVADAQASHVKVLGPRGTLQDSIGREGEGPGEFSNALQWIGLARDDSIHVQELLRVSVFAPNHSFARRFRLPRPIGSPREFLVPNQSAGYVALSSVIIIPSDPKIHRRQVVHYRSGGSADTLFSVPPPGLHIHEGDVVRPMPIPFSPSAHLALGPEGRLHYGWGERVSVVQYTLDGRAQDTIEVPFESVPVTVEDRARELSEIETGPARTALREKMPSAKPAFTRFLVDDEGRYWFGRPTANPDSTDWWVAWPGEQRVVTATLPSEVQFEVVKNGHAYGRTTTEDGAPALVRYQVRISE